MIDRRWVLAGIALGLGFLVGRSQVAPNPGAAFSIPATAVAGEVLSDVGPGNTFLSTDGGNAYLWRRTGDRIELLGQCQRAEGGDAGQAGYVWLPGVERRS